MAESAELPTNSAAAEHCQVSPPPEASDKKSEDGEDVVNFKVVWNKKNFDVLFSLDEKVLKLKHHMQSLVGIPPAMMKLMYKGILKDELTLRESKVSQGVKMMLVGSTIRDVIAVQPPSPATMKEDTKESGPQRESLCEAKEHKKIIEKGKPDDVVPGIRHKQEPLPSSSLSGMVNKYGSKVRLHFKLESEQLWIGTKERTEKIPLGSIRQVLSEPIKGQEEYHIMALQLGPTEQSRYWLYWIPAQYVEAIKDAILGKWQYF